MTNEELNKKYPKISIEEDGVVFSVFKNILFSIDELKNNYDIKNGTVTICSGGDVCFQGFSKAQLQALSKVALILADRVE